jgi:hypothetical protein
MVQPNSPLEGNDMTSFTDRTITEMSAGKSAMAGVASLVQKQQHKNVLNRIAMTYVALQNDRNAARAANLQPKLKPELLFSFIQQVCNKNCWNARRLLRAYELESAATEASTAQFGVQQDDRPDSNAPMIGVNPAERAEDEAGIQDGADVHEWIDIDPETGEIILHTQSTVEAFLLDDFNGLFDVHTWLSQKMAYLDDVGDLHLFADYRPPAVNSQELNWTLENSADDLASALALMNHLVAELGEQQAIADSEEAQTATFGSRPSTTKEGGVTVTTYPAQEKPPGFTAEAKVSASAKARQRHAPIH